MSVRLEKTDESVEVQRSYRPVAAPILQGVPRMRSAQDEGSASCVHEVVRISGRFERSVGWAESGVGCFYRYRCAGLRRQYKTDKCENQRAHEQSKAADARCVQRATGLLATPARF